MKEPIDKKPGECDETPFDAERIKDDKIASSSAVNKIITTKEEADLFIRLLKQQ